MGEQAPCPHCGHTDWTAFEPGQLGCGVCGFNPEPTAEDWLDAAEGVLREIQDNSKGQIEDPHFRHWAAATILSYFSARAVDISP